MEPVIHPELAGPDWHDVPLDELRRFAGARAARTSLRQTAADVGVGRTTLEKFIHSRTQPHPRIVRAIALLYLAEQHQGTGVVDDALRVLLAGVQAEEWESGAAEVLSLADAIRRRAEARQNGGEEVQP
jgi:hypothetical protein